MTWEIVGNGASANEPARVTRHQSRLATVVTNRDEQLEVELGRIRV